MAKIQIIGRKSLTEKQPRNLVASVRQRLMNLARKRGEDFQNLLTRYGLERQWFATR